MKSSKQLLILTALCAASFLFGSDIDGLNSQISKLKNEISGLQKETDRLKKSLGEDHPALKKYDCFHSYHGDLSMRFGGKTAEEVFLARNLNFLNTSVTNDSAFFVRTTIDYFSDFVYGEYDRSRLMLHSTFRFRYNWGSTTEVRIADTSATLDDILLDVKGTAVDKHLMWMQQAWLKIAMGDTSKPYDHYLQLGLLPFQVGRGISLGAAYQQGGFLGFTPGFSIDQYAPGVLFHVNPIPKKLSLECYVALLENKHISFKSNNESVRKSQLDNDCPQRGTSRHSYAIVMRGLWDPLIEKCNKLHFEPYVVYFQAPDQKLEFANDLDSMLTTYGFAVEGVYKKFSWGFETAINQGELLVKPWDRNTVTFSRDGTTGAVIEKYTKILSEDPNSAKFNDPSVTPKTAVVTSTNQTALKASTKSVGLNGKQIGTDLYNAYDRFRPKQINFLKGYFFIADFDFQAIDNVLKIACGAGYSSGDLNAHQNVNLANSNDLLQGEFYGFAPLQSVYSGTRLRHLIIFNRGVPRFNRRNPNGDFSKQNITPSLSREKAEFTNIAFAGTKFEWKPQACKKNKLTIAPNLIFYWVPETPVTVSEQQKIVVINDMTQETKTITTKVENGFAGNFMGTELTAEVSAYVADKLKLYGYMGVLFPGAYHKDMCGTLVDKQPTGHDMGFIANIGMSYAF